MTFQELENKLAEVVQHITTGTLMALAVEWRKSVTKNFELGGRPGWTPRKHISKKQKGTKILVISGAMKNVSTTPDTATNIITMNIDPRARAYARIQNEGGTINMPGRNLKFRKNKAGKTVFASANHKKITKEVISKPHTITIPKREYTNIPPEDFPRIVNAIKTQLSL